MGCDIHEYLEYKEDGVWKLGPEINLERNYDMFAILADVRNYDGFEQIVEPRGVPADSCQEILDACAQWEGDGHSHSYLTLADILNFDWTKTITQSGFVAYRGYASWRYEHKEPSEWW